MKSKIFLFALPVLLFASHLFVAHNNPVYQKIKDKDQSAKILDGVIYHGSRDKKIVALTFDADMTPGMLKKLQSGKVRSYYNREVIKVLEKEKVPATLFLTGLWAKAYPEVTQNFTKNPLFEIGNHSYSHFAFSYPCYNLPKLPEDKKELEFTQSQKVISEITGATPRLFRFPGGCFSKTDLKLAQKHSLQVVQWDVESGDAFNQNTQSIIRKVEKDVQSGSIVVFHMHDESNAPKTAEALPAIISSLKQQSYSFVKVSNLP